MYLPWRAVSLGIAGEAAEGMRRILAKASCAGNAAHAAEPATPAAAPDNKRGASVRERKKSDPSPNTPRSESDSASSLASKSEREVDLQTTFVAYQQGGRTMARIRRQGAAKTHQGRNPLGQESGRQFPTLGPRCPRRHQFEYCGRTAIPGSEATQFARSLESNAASPLMVADGGGTANLVSDRWFDARCKWPYSLGKPEPSMALDDKAPRPGGGASEKVCGRSAAPSYHRGDWGWSNVYISAPPMRNLFPSNGFTKRMGAPANFQDGRHADSPDPELLWPSSSRRQGFGRF